MEVWKSVVGYEGLYEVSSLGRVKSLDRYRCNNSGLPEQKVKERFLRQMTNASGYLKVCLYKNGQKSFLVHRLVTTAFIPNPHNKETVNHKNCIKTCNSVENLEWATRQENNLHSQKNGLQVVLKGEENGVSKLTKSDVFSIRNEHSAMQLRDIAKKFNVTFGTIWKIRKRLIWKHI